MTLCVSGWSLINPDSYWILCYLCIVCNSNDPPPPLLVVWIWMLKVSEWVGSNPLPIFLHWKFEHTKSISKGTLINPKIKNFVVIFYICNAKFCLGQGDIPKILNQKSIYRGLKKSTRGWESYQLFYFMDILNKSNCWVEMMIGHL